MALSDPPPAYTDAWIDPVKILAECATLCPEVLDAEHLDDLWGEAASFFYWLTGFRFNGSVARVADVCWTDECSNRCGAAHWDYPFMPVQIGGHWVNTVCGCYGTAACCDTKGIPLLPAPVSEVTAVSIDGVSFADFELRRGKVVRTDGDDWESCTRIEIDFVGGTNPPPWVARAARDYARELACLCYCPSKCSLPKDWSELRYEHVTISKQKAPDIVGPLLIGLSPYVTRVISYFLTPKGRPRRPGRVFSPDVKEPVHGFLA